VRSPIDQDNLILAIVLTIALLAFLLGVAVRGLPEPLERWSGYEWQEMNPEQRSYYTAGLMTGLWFGARATKLSEEPAAAATTARFFYRIAAFLDSHNLTEATAALDRFYLVGPRNVPIVFVLVTPEDRNQ
jgi:hypothetical protein